MSERVRFKGSFIKFCRERQEHYPLATWIEKQVKLAQKRHTRETELLEKIASLEGLLTNQEKIQINQEQQNVPDCDFLALDLRTGNLYCDGKLIVPVVCKRRHWRMKQREEKECLPKDFKERRIKEKVRKAYGSKKAEVHFPHGTVPFRKDLGWT